MKLYALITASILAASVAIPLRAQTTVTASINVPNFSFESPSSPSETSKSPTILSGWVFSVQGGSEYGSMALHSSNFSSVGAADGNNYAFINNDYPGVTDTLTSAASLGTIAPDTTYTLTVAIGNRNGTGLYNDPGNVSFSLLADGVAFATQEVTNGTVPNGTFEDFTLTYETPAAASIIGDDLTIQLATLPEESNAFQAGFDNVTLDATTIEAAPEPVTAILLVTGGLALVGFASLRRTRAAPLAAGCALLLLVATGTASADPISVPNASFETSTSGGGWTYNNPDTISDWTFNAPAGDPYGQLWTVFFNSPGTSQGNESALIDLKNPGEEADLTTAAPLGSILANTTYTLTVAVGNADLNNPALETGPLVFDPIGDRPPAPVTLTLLAGGQPFATEAIPANTVPDGTFQDFSLTYTTGDSDPVIGQQLTIQLGTESDSGAPAAAVFDNVRLDATANDIISGGGDEDGSGDPGTAPEPPSYGLLGLGLAALGWLSRWQRFQRDCLC